MTARALPRFERHVAAAPDPAAAAAVLDRGAVDQGVFENAGTLGHRLMAIPMVGAHMQGLLQIYREAWTRAGHPGRGKVMLAFHMFCAESRAKAAAIARAPLNHYLKSIVDAASGWMSGVSSRDYPNYHKMIQSISEETFESQVEKSAAWIGTPDDIRNAIELRP